MTGVALFDADSNEVFFFTYGGAGFTLSDGSDSLGGHAGESAGGSSATQSVVIDPAYGIVNPRYTCADGETLGTTASQP